MVGIFLARTLIGDIEKVKFNYYWADVTVEVTGERCIDRDVVLKNMCGEKDSIFSTTSSTFLKTIYWIHICPVHLDAVTRVPSLLVYLQVHFILLIKMLFFIGPLTQAVCTFWDHFKPRMKDTATWWSLISVDIQSNLRSGLVNQALICFCKIVSVNCSKYIPFYVVP